MRDFTEVIVVGAGPAGAATAIWLARAGRDVLIVERSSFPRDKPCGDCANPGVVEELRRLGVADRLGAALSPKELLGWRIEAPDGSAFTGEFGGAAAGRDYRAWAVRRRDLDHALLDEARRAGARVRFGFRAFDLSRSGDRVDGVIVREGSREVRLGARWVVGADGLRSVVRRRLDLTARPSRLRKIALVSHLRGFADPAQFGELRVRGGRCCGYAPLADGANVTLVVPQREASNIRGGARGFFLAAIRDFPEVEKRVRRADMDRRIMVTGPFDCALKGLWAPGAVLVGDAAGYFDPFTGQGIHQALLGARLAAAAVAAALEEPRAETRMFGRYARQVRRRRAATQALQRMIEAVISRPALMSRFVRTLSRGDGTAARWLLRATGDIAHPITAFDPHAWLGTISWRRRSA